MGASVLSILWNSKQARWVVSWGETGQMELVGAAVRMLHPPCVWIQNYSFMEVCWSVCVSATLVAGILEYYRLTFCTNVLFFWGLTGFLRIGDSGESLLIFKLNRLADYSSSNVLVGLDSEWLSLRYFVCFPFPEPGLCINTRGFFERTHRTES